MSRVGLHGEFNTLVIWKFTLHLNHSPCLRWRRCFSSFPSLLPFLYLPPANTILVQVDIFGETYLKKSNKCQQRVWVCQDVVKCHREQTSETWIVIFGRHIMHVDKISLAADFQSNRHCTWLEISRSNFGNIISLFFCLQLHHNVKTQKCNF